jgi:5'-nucleotidase
VWIRIITHRLLFNGLHEPSAADTAVWLDQHDIPYRDLCFIGDKAMVGADLYIDDSPHNIVNLREAGRTAVVFDQRYNRHLDGPSVRAGRGRAAGARRLAGDPARASADEEEDLGG